MDLQGNGYVGLRLRKIKGSRITNKLHAVKSYKVSFFARARQIVRELHTRGQQLKTVFQAIYTQNVDMYLI